MWTEIIRCGFKFPSWLWLTSAETAVRELIIKPVSCWRLTCYLGTICQLFWKFFIEETALMTMILPLSLQDYSLHQHGLDLISSLFLLYMLKCNYNRKYCVKECWIYFQKGGGGGVYFYCYLLASNSQVLNQAQPNWFQNHLWTQNIPIGGFPHSRGLYLIRLAASRHCATQWPIAPPSSSCWILSLPLINRPFNSCSSASVTVVWRERRTVTGLGGFLNVHSGPQPVSGSLRLQHSHCPVSTTIHTHIHTHILVLLCQEFWGLSLA